MDFPDSRIVGIKFPAFINYPVSVFCYSSTKWTEAKKKKKKFSTNSAVTNAWKKKLSLDLVKDGG